jgi:FlaA1/EpsC-like NDP-sugar epimerase
MGNGGEVFVFDMGKPVKIADLAKKMITLSGRIPNKDILIHYSGLRPGEKLYEELLIDTRDQSTSHPLIRRACEPNPSDHHLLPLLNELENALSRWDDKGTSDLLLRLVPEYNRDNRSQGSV